MVPTLNAVDHVHVYVANRESATKWYEDVLGLCEVSELKFWSVGGGPLTISNISGTIHLALFERPAEKCHSTIALGASANEFLAWRNHLSRVFGHEIELVNHEVSWSIYFSDPDGNPFEITSYEHSLILSQLPLADG
ncbi:MAG: VOC family protein [Anaerolineae bacterium]|nr:VOC family protein [Gloeobacterales cyanobacterium ES-bin-313]